MGLSSNILWHQTTEKGFYAILDSGQLRYGYSLETILSHNDKRILAFPMVSVCDLPFSELDFFLNCEKCYGGNNFHNYGGFVIGFNIEWGRKNGFTPVWYCDPHSDILSQLFEQWDAIATNLFLYTLSGHIKNSEGELEKAKADVYRFLDEREYRKLAPFDILPDDSVTLEAEAYRAYKEKNDKSPLLPPDKAGVHFDSTDLAYIIVPDSENKKKLLRYYGHIISRTPVFTRDEVNANFIGIRHHHVVEPEEETIKTKAYDSSVTSVVTTESKQDSIEDELNRNFTFDYRTINVGPWTEIAENLAKFAPVQLSTDSFKKSLQAFQETLSHLNPLEEYTKLLNSIYSNLRKSGGFPQK